MKRAHEELFPRVGIWIQCREPLSDGLDFRVGGGDGRVIAQPRDAKQVVTVAPCLGLFEGKRHPDFGLRGSTPWADELEAIRHHAHHGVVDPIKTQRTADGVRVAAEELLPKRVIEDDDRRCAGGVVGRLEKAAEHRLHAERAQHLGRTGDRVYGLGILAADVDGLPLVDPEIMETR
jgi:hypothetical protein